MNDFEAVSLAVEVMGVACLKFLFQIERRLRIVFTGHGQHGVQETIDLGVSGSKQLDLMPAPGEMLAEVKNNPLRSAVSLRWD